MQATPGRAARRSRPAGQVERVQVAVVRADVDHPVGHRREGVDQVPGGEAPQLGAISQIEPGGPSGERDIACSTDSGKLASHASAELANRINVAHRYGSAVAVHCVTTDQLVITVAAFEEAERCDRAAGSDRIEHAGVVPPGYAERLASLGLAAVAQPGFIAARGDAYRREVPAAEQDWLYPAASLLGAGVAVAAGTDAPYGPADPWLCIASTITRRTPDGAVLGWDERVSASRALEMFLAAPANVRQTRSVAPGRSADLCQLHTPLHEALANPSASTVHATIIGGELIYAALAILPGVSAPAGWSGPAAGVTSLPRPVSTDDQGSRLIAAGHPFDAKIPSITSARVH